GTLISSTIIFSNSGYSILSVKYASVNVLFSLSYLYRSLEPVQPLIDIHKSLKCIDLLDRLIRPAFFGRLIFDVLLSCTLYKFASIPNLLVDTYIASLLTLYVSITSSSFSLKRIFGASKFKVFTFTVAS